jgi:hypothetical protein
MPYSRTIAGIAGPLLAVVGAALLLNRHQIMTMAAEISRNLGLIYLSGMLLVAAGIAIVRVHNLWTGDWRLAVTLLGWLAVVGGAVRMLVPQLAEPLAASIAGRPIVPLVAGIVVALLGLFLSYKAYGPES